jgi:hypothetical protein
VNVDNSFRIKVFYQLPRIDPSHPPDTLKSFGDSVAIVFPITNNLGIQIKLGKKHNLNTSPISKQEIMAKTYLQYLQDRD